MPPMCRSYPDVNKLRGMDTTILGQHRPFMSIKLFVQHSRWQEMVSLCSLIRLIGVCADCDQPEFLCSGSDSRYIEVHVVTAGGWLTRYRSREVRNSIYRYRKIHIDYRSQFLYQFISPISIIYGNTIGLSSVTSCMHVFPTYLYKEKLRLSFQCRTISWFEEIYNCLHMQHSIHTVDNINRLSARCPPANILVTMTWDNTSETILLTVILTGHCKVKVLTLVWPLTC